MTSIPQTHFTIADTQLPSRGIHNDLIAVILHPISFFKVLRRRQNSHTFLVAVLVLISMVVFSLQMTPSTSTTDTASGFDAPIDSFPIDPIPSDPNSLTTNDDSTVMWVTALTTISIQAMSWSALTLWLALVTMFNSHKPRLGKNLEIIIWASVPIALMAILQTVFIFAGGTISSAGFSGFLDEWTRFAEYSIFLQSWLYALASQITIFWLWHLGLLYVGARYVLGGKRSIVLFTIISWIIALSMVNSFPAYQDLKAQLPETDPTLSDEPMFDDMPSDEGDLGLESPVAPDMGVDIP